MIFPTFGGSFPPQGMPTRCIHCRSRKEEVILNNSCLPILPNASCYQRQFNNVIDCPVQFPPSPPSLPWQFLLLLKWPFPCIDLRKHASQLPLNIVAPQHLTTFQSQPGILSFGVSGLSAGLSFFSTHIQFGQSLQLSASVSSPLRSPPDYIGFGPFVKDIFVTPCGFSNRILTHPY